MNERDKEQLSLAPDGRPVSEQPRWRKDFPIDWPEDHYVARRDFTKFLVLTSLAFAVGQFWIGVQNFFRKRRGEPAKQLIARIDEIEVGGSKTFAYPEAHDKCVLVRLDENTFTAFSQQCTHLSCAVVPDPESKCFRCPCHEGLFDIATGRPIAGPPRRPLAQVKLEINKDSRAIYATGVELRTV
ncbi:MAG TPA: Rieske 2Fe-2S domain-containing protein [Blastocatellia bacterium]|nr:Rieske 2Fe-2S domain-containing protein [Blastocatellia bacterium]